MKRTTLACVLGALIGVAPATVAAGDFTSSGLYVGVGATGAIHLFESEVDDVFESLGGTADVDESLGANARIGYRLASWAAIEAQYEWVEAFKVSATAPSIGITQPTEVAELEAHSVTGNLKLILPISRVQPYLLLGVGWSNYDLSEKVSGTNLGRSDDALAGRVGPGIDIYLTESLALNIQATALLTTHDVDNVTATEGLSALHYVSTQAGLLFHF